jgi:endonuclease/exonuclease/phosphatase family metal-dependent hydrolase
VMGDLNMTPRTARRSSGLRPLAAASTFPAEQPTRQLDHILTDDPSLRGTEVTAPRLAISDHRPLVVEVSKA